MKRFLRLTCLTLVFLVLAASCSTGGREDSGKQQAKVRPKGSNVASVSVDDEWKPSDAYDEVAAKITDDGLPAADALKLFSIQYGPIPGVEAVEGENVRAREGNLAISMVFRVWSDLEPAQQVAVRKALGLPEDFNPGAPVTPVDESDSLGSSGMGLTGEGAGTVLDQAATVVTRVAARLSDGPGTEEYRRSLDQVQTVIEGHLGPLEIPVVLESSSGVSSGDPLADATLITGADGVTTCRIRVFPSVFPAPSGPSVTMGHEVIHCYQFLWSDRNPPWVTEGTAEWGGMTAAAEAGNTAEDDALRENFADYYRTADRSLWSRSYDAVGWWAHVQEMGGDVWTGMRTALQSGSSPAAYDAATSGVGQQVVAEWGTSQALGTEIGGRWLITGPGVPQFHHPFRVFHPLPNGSSQQVSAPAYGSGRKGINFTGDLLRVEVSDGTLGFLRVEDNDRPLAELTSSLLCTSPSGTCVCPPGTRREGQQFARLGTGNSVVGMSGGPVDGSVTFSAVSLEDECERETNCLIGTWTQDGPPANDLFTTISGGGGTTVTFNAEGRVTFDFSTMEPWKASPRSDSTGVITASLAGTGFGTAQYPDPPSSTARITVTDVDMASVTGNAAMNVNGVDVGTVGGDFVREMWGAVDGADWTVASCEGDVMSLGAGTAVATYHRAG